MTANIKSKRTGGSSVSVSPGLSYTFIFGVTSARGLFRAFSSPVLAIFNSYGIVGVGFSILL
ncbi:MAG TPA: hypothetical protein DD471_13580, partial [Planctomycetes bacterium]|nr:hypothetical protein [Planctomycetota bacterium]